MAAKIVLPNAASLVRAILLQTIADRRAGVDSSLALGSTKLMAQRVLNPGSYDVLIITDDAAAVVQGGAANRALRSYRGGV